MSLRKIGFFILSFVLVFSACKKDDVDSVTPIDLVEQLKADNDSIVSYLETHFYNSGALASNPNIDDLEITEIAKGGVVPDGHTLLNDVKVEASYDIGDLNYKYYSVIINQGGGVNSPTFADNILIAYEGTRLLYDTVFDSRLNPNPSNLDLTELIRGWQLILPKFNTSQGAVDNGDGTITYNNPGVGIMFLPAGLSYLFSGSSNGLTYDPLIFKFELLKSFENDHDNDGVPSYLEDYKTNDQIFTVSADETVIDDDTDGDGLPDYVDTDDDGDGVLTINEDINGDGDPTNDIGKNGIPNYLDPEETTTKE